MEKLLSMVKTQSKEAVEPAYSSLSSGFFTKWFARIWPISTPPVRLASLFVLGLFMTVILTTYNGDITDQVVQEVMLNHSKRLFVEFAVETYAGLGEQMTKLDFIPRASKRLARDRYQLLGARYCSIHGQLATQIKLRGDAGEIHTLYQTLYSEALIKLSEGSVQRNGLKILLWTEAGLLYVLASPIL
jgi:hypothetical protein